MAKKPVKGRNVFTEDAEPVKKFATTKPLNVVPKKEREFPKSFRLTQSDLQKLKRIKDGVNERSTIKFSEAKIIRALISIGIKMKPERIIKAFGDIL